MSTGNSAERLQASREAAAKTKGFQRITALFDEGTFNEVDSFAKSGDGSAEVVAGYGEVDGCPVYAFVQNSDVDGGAMSKAQAAKIKKIYDLAVKTGSPVVAVRDVLENRWRRICWPLTAKSFWETTTSPVLCRRSPLCSDHAWVPLR